MNYNVDTNNNLSNLDLLCERLSDGRIPLKSVGDLNFVDDRGYTLLLLASIKGDLELVRALASRSEVIYSDCYRLMGANSDPLHMAIKFQHHDLVRFLLEEGRAQLDSCDSHGHTPLYYSIGDRALFSYLLANGANLDFGKDNPLKLAVNSLNTRFIDTILPYVTRRHLSSYCPFTDLAYSYCDAIDLSKRLNMFEFLLRHPRIRWRSRDEHEENLKNVVKWNKFRFLRLLLANHYEADELNLNELFARRLSDSSYCAKLLAVLKLTYYLGFKFTNVHPGKCQASDVRTVQQFSSWNARNPFFGDLGNFGDPFANTDKELISLDRTQVYQSFLHWKHRRPAILSLKQIGRIALRKHFGPHLTLVLSRIRFPQYLVEFLDLDDLQDYLEVLDYA